MRVAVAGGTGTVGCHVVDVLREHGHTAVVLTRSEGIDLVAATGLEAALANVDAVIDVVSVSTTSAEESKRFFGAVTSALLAAEVTAGVGHHVALGIVGSDLAPYGYYAGKMAEEQLVETGPVPFTILRATQFHEFARQIYGRITLGPIVVIPRMVSQPIAAREVAERLVELVVAGPSGRVLDLAGPRVERMADMVRAYAAATGGTRAIVEIPLPGGFGRAMRDGTLTAKPGSRTTLGRQSYAEWIAELPGRPTIAPD